ncbi:hypothetical protein MSAN_01748300 [Mycena sanguinolenta]|uniref:Uncharacterized protein n=1 Tax=Mycena sanguinolenta TaxID=230812 RepID=A0A8H6XX60_9AGAR|nr:hypothetical protein MSAN_01748300 [Mycena sanguinolenta]
MSSDSPTLSDIEILLTRLGRDITQDVVLAITESVFCSAYGIFFAVALYSIFRKGLRSRATSIMLFVVVYMYASSVTQWAMNVWTALKGIHSLLMTTDVPIPDRPILADEDLTNIIPPEEALFVLNMIVGDAVVIWRTWAVHGRRILAILIPCILLLVSFIFGLIDITCNSYYGAAPLPGAAAVCPRGALIGWAFSVATNISCTILIGFKAWQHRRMMRELDPQGKVRRISSEKVLSLLVESGSLYSLLWLTQVVAYLNFPRASSGYYAWTVLKAMGNQMAGLYPTLIILIVNFRRTIWEEEEAPSSTAVSNSIRWAPNSTGIRTGMTDIFGTQHGDDSVHGQSFIDITREKSTRPPAENYAA